MLESGFIQLHRSLLSWEWYSDVNTTRLFIHLLLTVNYEPKKWRGTIIERGQRICSISKLAEETRLSPRSVRTAILRLQETGEVTKQTTPQHTVITIKNYDKYQSTTNERQAERQTSDKQTTNERQQWNKDNKAIINTPPLSPPAKVQFAEYVTMTNDEYDKLLATHGEANTKRLVEILDNYKGSAGKRYKSDYRAILSWCVDRLAQEQGNKPEKPPPKPVSTQEIVDYYGEGT